jgi:tetratricopeptide (TPR) repeat protein
VLLIGSFRSGEARERAVAWRALQAIDREGSRQRLELARLSAEETAELVRRGLGLTREAPRFEARLYRETEGNPLFVLETLRALRDGQVLYRGESGEWSTPWDDATTGYAELPLPAEVYQVISRRLSWLGPDEREMLNTAAVLGADFELVLALMACDLEQEWALAALSELVRRRLLEEEQQALRFSHDKVHEVAYMEMEEPARRQLHLQAGEALETLHPEQVEALAHHYVEAEMWEKALRYSQKAGERARAMYAGAEAIDHYNRALEAWRQSEPADEKLGLSLYQARGEICQETGRFDQAEVDFEAAIALAQRTDKRHAQARATNNLSYLHFQRGDFERSTTIAQQALEIAQAADMPLQTARALLNQANGLRNLGYHREAITLYERAIPLFDGLDDQVHLADCLNRMGAALRHIGAYGEARSLIDRSLVIRRRVGDMVGVSYSLTNLTGLLLIQGEFSRAREAAREALEVATHIGDPYGQDAALCNLGAVAVEQAHPTEAIPLLERALVIARRIGDKPLEPDALSALGRAYHYLGDIHQAREMLERAVVVAETHVEGWYAPLPHSYLAEVLLAAGESQGALHHAQVGLQMALELNVPRPLGVAQRVMGKVAGRLGSEEAGTDPRGHFEESIRILRGIGAQAELGWSLAAYGRYLSPATLPNSADRSAALIQEAQEIFERVGVAVDLAQLQGDARLDQHLHIRVRLPSASAPTGRPLQDNEWVNITWKVAAPEDEAVLRKTLRRQHRLMRLLGEAEEQGAAPTVDDLAGALEVSRATIKRDLAALRERGHLPRTRGSRRR